MRISRKPSAVRRRRILLAVVLLVAAGVSPAGFTRAFTFNVIAALVAALLAAMVVPAGKAPAEAMPHAH